MLHSHNLDCLGVTEANLRKEADLQEVSIPGYRLVCDQGIENSEKKNSRVVAYVKEELSYQVMKNHMSGDLMPEIWLKLGHSGTRRTLVGFVYREHKPWKSKDDSVRGQEERWKAWLQCRRPIWGGTEEAYMLGDLNVDWKRQEDSTYRNSKMLKNMKTELAELGWTQIVKHNTHYSNRNGAVSESLIDQIWTNCPAKVTSYGQEEMATSDHQLVWVDRSSKNLVEKVKESEKRLMKNFDLKDLEELCRQETWTYTGKEPRTEEMLNARVETLEDKINCMLEKVAPMRVKKSKTRGRPRWMTPALQARMKERLKVRNKAKRTKTVEDEKEARRIRNQVSKEVKSAERDYMKVKLDNLSTSSGDSWSAVGEFLGWRKPVHPTMLVQEGNVITRDQELAEAMLNQYRKKEVEVEQALGPAKGDYLEMSRKMTKGNKGVFSFRKVTQSEVKQQILKVDNKESFGHDRISYGFIKKISKWIVVEVTEIINLSLEVRRYPKNWKIARVKPHFKGEGCDRHAAKSFRPVALLSALSRITEALLARQLHRYQEKFGLLHRGVHCFRRGRGTHTAMLETWEYVLAKTEKGELVAIDLLDTSAAFDTLVHLYLQRKMEVEVGMTEASLEWLASYLKEWLQYVVVGAKSSTVRQTTRGAPQGGGFSPNLFRGYTNVIPEAGLMKKQ